MAQKKGILGQAAPSAATDADLYTVPDGKNATIKVIVSNRDSSPATFQIRVRVAGAVNSTQQLIAPDRAIPANDSLTTTSFMVGGDDVVTVQASTSTVSFTCTGIEQDDED